MGFLMLTGTYSPLNDKGFVFFNVKLPAELKGHDEISCLRMCLFLYGFGLCVGVLHFCSDTLINGHKALSLKIQGHCMCITFQRWTFLSRLFISLITHNIIRNDVFFSINFSLMTSLNSLGVLMSIPQDEFKIYSWKKVIWISLSALNRTSGLTPDHPLIADVEYIINRAIRKPDLKVSKCTLSLRCQRIKESFI